MTRRRRNVAHLEQEPGTLIAIDPRTNPGPRMSPDTVALLSGSSAGATTSRSARRGTNDSAAPTGSNNAGSTGPVSLYGGLRFRHKPIAVTPCERKD
ncbi:hypothetical protein MBRA_56080 (plasmid) [Mycobacterium branderi]|uniref:Uncharacterized protein n=1 Tax=Mycobacterium branderi TaxID=43348 RepID=A0ABM7KWC5_9MYCO|nr:hypothetical protein MBRA_56080 [Mycobacterium branderi]